ncbi:MAG: calcium-binding protein [Pseudomonadota bacterium]
MAIIDGTAGNDTLSGVSIDSDILRGLGGNDTYEWFYDDRFRFIGGGQGIKFYTEDSVVESANAGIDTVALHNRSDIGKTTYTLPANVENAYGNSSDAWILNGNTLPNRLTGEDRNDDIDGRDGNDVIDGRGGNDSLLGGIGLDRIFGGAGADTMNGGQGSDSLFGGAGRDLAVFDAPTGVRVDLLVTGAQNTGAGLDLVRLVEDLRSGTGHDRLLGDNGANSLDGSAGNDSLFGRGGNDVLIGGAGNDLMLGGSGVDTALFSGTGATRLDLALATQQNTLHGIDILREIENVITGAGNDLIRGNDAANRITGAAGNDILIGRAGNDTLTGDAGRDRLVGDDGRDLMFGGDGADVLNGGTETDTLIGGAGSDLLFAGAGDDVLSGGADADTMIGSGGNDRFLADGADLMRGDAGNDSFVLTADAAIARGGAGRDVFLVDAGFQGAQLSGGAERDSFIFRRFQPKTDAFSGADTITDYQRGLNEVIDLSAIDPDPVQAGDQDFVFTAVENVDFQIITNVFGAVTDINATFLQEGDSIALRAVEENSILMLDTNGDREVDATILFLNHTGSILVEL